MAGPSQGGVGSCAGGAGDEGANDAFGDVAPGRTVTPVASVIPLALTTGAESTFADSSGSGGDTTAPFASRHAPGAYHRRPSTPRSKTQGENAAPFGATTQRPAVHAQRRRRQVHSPSIQTAPDLGRGGTTSTRPGGGGATTSTRASCGCAV